MYHVEKKIKVRFLTGSHAPSSTKLSVLQPATKYQLITNLLTSASLADVQNASLSSVLTRGSYYSNFVVPAGGMPAACEAGLT